MKERGPHVARCSLDILTEPELSKWTHEIEERRGEEKSHHIVADKPATVARNISHDGADFAGSAVMLKVAWVSSFVM
jgi:hypothetical protein